MPGTCTVEDGVEGEQRSARHVPCPMQTVDISGVSSACKGSLFRAGLFLHLASGTWA